MAENRAKKPRIRKTAPTKREQVEAASTQKKQERRIKRAVGVVTFPFKKVKKADNPFSRLLRKVLLPLKKILRFIIPNYFINSWREVRQVTWPNRKETWRLMLTVFIFAIIFGALVSGVDKILDETFKKVILK